MIRKVVFVVVAVVAFVVVALVLLPQRQHTVTVRPGLVRVMATFDDGSDATFNFVNLDGQAQMVKDVFVERFDGGTHQLELLVIEPAHSNSAKYALELKVEGAPVKGVQDVTIEAWRLTPRGVWNAVTSRLKRAAQ